MMNSNNKEYKFFIDFIKCLAVALIINSHLDPIYPHSALATGGALGNSLFFIASGYLLKDKKKDLKFFVRFFIKLYLPLYIITIVSGLIQGRSIISQLIWPTNYWFIGAIVLFYILYTILENIGVFRHIHIFYIAVAVMYIVIYVFVLDTSEWVVESVGLYDIKTCFKLIYYFAIMVTGGVIKGMRTDYRMVNKSRIIYILSIIAMYASKFIISKNNNLMVLQFTNQLFAYTFAVAMFVAAKESNLIQYIENKETVKKIIIYISSCSLDIYLVQFIVIDFSSRKFAFPASLIIAIVGIIILASFLHLLSGLVQKIIQKCIFSNERVKAHE